jgi:Uma2 family endonuclease
MRGQEYWLVDPVGEVFEIYVSNNGKYAMVDWSNVLQGINLTNENS